MYIETLDLKNFRNYETLSLTFDPGTNVFYGDNAQGKTNILESVNVCGTSKSYRSSKDSEMIRFGEDEAHIRMHLQKGGVQRRIDMHLRKNKSKGVAIDGIPIRKAAELLSLVHLVFFSPEDLNIIKRGPGGRRRFLDALLSQMDPFYLHQLSAYQKILLQRNKLLKDLPGNRSLEATLDVWDEQLISYGCYLINSRSRMIQELEMIVRERHSALTNGREQISLQYEPNAEETAFRTKLRDSREKDRKFRQTTTGPHRDDFKVIVGGIDLRHYGSQGQQRSAALSLKLAEISLIEQKIHEKPILLLDDVLSELDSRRQSDLLKTIGSVHSFLTCTGMDDLRERNFPIDRVFHVEAGHVDEPGDV